MKWTYRAQVTGPGALELVERETPSLGVLIAVEACGNCGADAADFERPAKLPRVPGHEVVRRHRLLNHLPQCPCRPSFERHSYAERTLRNDSSP